MENVGKARIRNFSFLCTNDSDLEKGEKSSIERFFRFQIIAGRNRDALTLGVACALEKTLGSYVPPCTVTLTGEGKYVSAEKDGVVRRNCAAC